jgi:hypothetical protein
MKLKRRPNASRSFGATLKTALEGAQRTLTHRWVPVIIWKVQRSGVIGLTGLALLMASSLFYYTSYLSVVDEIDALRGSVRDARVKPKEVTPMAGVARDALVHLPDRDALTRQLGTVYDSAQRAGIVIESAKYDAAVSKGGDIIRYKVAFPVTGRYEQIRAFVDDILARVPTLSIGEFAIQRKAVADPIVEARIRVTFYARNRP